MNTIVDYKIRVEECPKCRDGVSEVFASELRDAEGFIACENCGTLLLPLDKKGLKISTSHPNYVSGMVLYREQRRPICPPPTSRQERNMLGAFSYWRDGEQEIFSANMSVLRAGGLLVSNGFGGTFILTPIGAVEREQFTDVLNKPDTQVIRWEYAHYSCLVKISNC